MTLKIIVVTSHACGFCVRAKNLLIDKGVSFTEINISEQPELRADLIEKSGMRTVPMIFIDDVCIGGYKDLLQLEQTGHLDNLLKTDSN